MWLHLSKKIKVLEIIKIGLAWRGRIVAECSGLLNRRIARYRGFESLSLRNNRKVLTDPSNTPKWVDGAC